MAADSAYIMRTKSLPYTAHKFIMYNVMKLRAETGRTIRYTWYFLREFGAIIYKREGRKMHDNIAVKLSDNYLGTVVLIDDDDQILIDEKALIGRLGFNILIFNQPKDLEINIKKLLENHRGEFGNVERLVFLVDNRMNTFAQYWVHDAPLPDNVVPIRPTAVNSFGKDGQFVGMAICHWLLATFEREFPGFKVITFSAFDEMGIRGRISSLKKSYPSYAGFFRKITSADRASGEQAAYRTALERYLLGLVSSAKGGNISARKVHHAEDHNYPAAKILKWISSKLLLTREEVAAFLSLSPTGIEKLDVLFRSPSQFILDTTGWRERVRLTAEAIAILEHDLKSEKAVVDWVAAPNEICSGVSPREIFIEGSTDEIRKMRDILRFEL